jgi:hypothetical protein
MQLQFVSITSSLAFNKDAFPTRRHSCLANPSFSLPKQAQFFCVSLLRNFQAQQAFVRFAVTGGTALPTAFAREPDLRSGTFKPMRFSL